MDFLQPLFDLFWIIVAKLSGWHPDQLLKSQLQFVGAVLGIIGGVFGVYKTARYFITGRSMTDADIAAFDEIIAKKVEQRLAKRFAAQSSPSSNDDAIQQEAQQAVKTVAIEGGEEGRKALTEFAETGNLESTREELARLATQHEQAQLEAGRNAARYYRRLGALAYLDDTSVALQGYRKAVELAPDNPDGWIQLGNLLERVGEFEQAVSVYQKVLMLAEAMLGEEAKAWQAKANHNLGIIYQIRGDLELAEQMARKSLAIDEQLNDQQGMALSYGSLGIIYQIRGDLELAEQMHKKSLSISTELDFKEGMASQYGNLGILYQTRGDLGLAEQMLKKSLSINQELGNSLGESTQYANLGIVYRTRGDLELAEQMHKKSLSISTELDFKEGMANQYGALGILYGVRGELGQAELMILKGLALEEELGNKQGMAASCGNLGNIYKTRGDLDRAEEMQLKSLAIDEELGSKQGIATSYGNLGQIYKMRGDLERAEEMQLRSLAIDEELGNKEGMASAYANLGGLANQRGDASAACENLHNARALYYELGIPHMIEEMEYWLRENNCPDMKST